MADPKTTYAHIELVIDLLSAATTGQPVNELAAHIVDRLDAFNTTLINPPGSPPVIEAYGDEKSRRVVNSLMAHPAVLYGVLGILHNIKVAGPWEHKAVDQRKKKQALEGGLMPADLVTQEFWFRLDARQGSQVAKITPLDEKRGNTQCKWEIQNTDPNGPPSVQSGNSADLPKAMATVDVYLGVQQGWLLVPGWKEA